MEILNKPLLEFLGYNIYPGFFILLALIAGLSLGAVFIVRSRENDISDEALKKPLKVKKTKKQKINVQTIEQDIKEENPENTFNLITAWQKNNLALIIDKEITNSIDDGVDEDDDYIRILTEINEFIQSSKYWSVAKLVSIHENAVLFLTTLIAEHLEFEIHDGNNDRATLFANTIDRVNGSFELEYTGDEEVWFTHGPHENEPSSNLDLNTRRYAASLISALSFVTNHTDENGILDESIPYLDNGLIMKTQRDINSAYEDVLTNENPIENLLRDSRTTILYSLIFALRHQIDKLTSHERAKVLRPNDINTIRAIAMLSDEQNYNDIILDIMD